MQDDMKFEQLMNIGPTVAGYLRSGGYTVDRFLVTKPEDVFMDLIEVIGPEKALRGAYPNMLCRCLWAAQNQVPWDRIPPEIAQQYTELGQRLKASL